MYSPPVCAELLAVTFSKMSQRQPAGKEQLMAPVAPEDASPLFCCRGISALAVTGLAGGEEDGGVAGIGEGGGGGSDGGGEDGDDDDACCAMADSSGENPTVAGRLFRDKAASMVWRVTRSLITSSVSVVAAT